MQTHDQKNDKKPNGNPAPTPPTTTAAPKPTDSRPPAGALGSNANTDEKKKREGRKVYIVVGEIKEFKNKAEAEKFLNTAEAPTDFTVVVGNKIEKKQKVSLR